MFHTLLSGTLIPMFGRSRLLLLLGLAAILMGLVTIPGGSVQATDVFAGGNHSVWQAQSPARLNAWVSPEAGKPGDQLSLNLNLFAVNSHTPPELEIFLPGSLALDLAALPLGTSFNTQTNSLIWQPIFDDSEDRIDLVIPLIVSSVDLSTPDQSVNIVLKEGPLEENYSAPFWVGVLPQPTIKFSLPQAAVGQVVQLVGEISGPGPHTQIWNLGDGRTVAVNNPEVIFSTPGTYQVTLQASNPIGISIATAQLIVSAHPIARFTVQDPSPTTGEVVTFVNQSGGQQPLQYLWEFGDGTVSTEVNPTHYYPEVGAYRVHLTISNELGQSDTYQELLVGQRPSADIVIENSPAAGRLFEVQSFHDDTVATINWDMGDGHYYEGELINHVYWSAGDYLITATFTNNYGETVIQQWVQVGPGTLYLYLPFIPHSGAGQMAPSSVAAVSQGTPSVPEDVLTEEAKRLQFFELPQEMQPAEQLFAYINEARLINNLAPLQMVNELNAAAQFHTDDMAAMGYTGHEGSDGSTPALRIQLSTYAGGYAGEATAWGMPSAVEPVQFWLNSPTHRDILLNPSATEVGVGYSQNFNAPSVWYWTAEFASMNLPPVHIPIPKPEPMEASGPATEVPVPQVIQLLGPPQDSDFLLSNENYLIFTWTWPDPLLTDQRFVLYLNSQGRIYQIGAVTEVQSGIQYQYKVLASEVPVAPGSHQWVVRLENSKLGELVEESSYWPISFRQP